MSQDKRAYRVPEGERVHLKDHAPSDHGGLSREEAAAEIERHLEELGVIQEELYAAGKNSVLIVLQGLDASGKDGTIRKVMSRMSPQGVGVTSFKVPTPEEAGHDFLWREHKAAPMRGMVGVFNRSHYEGVLVERVHHLITGKECERRYREINQFEHLLARDGTIVLKFFLHITKDEQYERLKDRETQPGKAWKLSAGDWHERTYWDDYQEAFADALSACSTDEAPWYIVPANHKWYRDLAVCEALVDALRNYRKPWREALEEVGKSRMAELAAYRALHPEK